MLASYNIKMPHAVYCGENAMSNVTNIITTAKAQTSLLQQKHKKSQFSPTKALRLQAYLPYLRRPSRYQVLNITS